MGGFRGYSYTLCLLLWWNVIADKSFGYAADLSGNEERKSMQSVSNGYSYIYPLSLSAWFPTELEVSDYCLELLRIFGQRYTSLGTCLVSNARPVKVCQNCYTLYNGFQEIYGNISTNQMGPGSVSCQDVLMRSNRLMLLYNLYSNLEDIWDSAGCVRCLTPHQKSVSNTTLHFIETLNQSLSCFEKYQQGNHSELCKECRTMYKKVNALYSNMSRGGALCIDIEDAMNVTRHLWSTTFGCSFPREEMVPVIALTGFMLFLPIIFYLSNFLHSEQKKRKLIQPKRATSNHSLMNIQDKFS